ncbi:ABC transporter substrate-binding protein [Aureimonas fodinaquatilis]|uniref:ABC transporter substrate-binding protein n=1 Tax=Aureimonas fodinaquatilis TaxID=2565783 RepID=A0A5B0DSN2_9HYPH|nr:ABC transporter substrate-binding protein [Aureimonas fodinaquatilis]KAA0969476.1 ABC transporter substrate-binding protein [Aureimonas fodinaquatilis]
MKYLAYMAAGVAVTAMMPAMAQAQERVVFASTGGVFEQALREAWFTPFTAETGIEVVSVTATDAEMRARAQAMVQAGDVTWDIINNVDILAESAQNRAFTIDLAEFCQQFEDRADLVDKACNPAGVRLSLNGTLLVYNTQDFPDGGPTTWQEFWDVANFPGPRALPNLSDPWRVFAGALLADGVPADQLFPLDIDRALAKLDEIRPEVELWWRTGDQSQQGFRSGEYVTGMIWGTRANALKDEDQPIAMSFDGAFMLADTLQILQNAPHQENALKLVQYYLNNPAVQANFAKQFGITPPSSDAVALLDDEARSKIPSPDEFKKTVQHDSEWISANQEKLADAWNDWITQ